MIILAGEPVEGVLFDKDGTLLDFHRTWDRAVGLTLAQLAPDQASLEGAATAVGYDLVGRRVEVDSPIIAESNATIMALLAPWMDVGSFEELLRANGISGAHPVPGAAPLLDDLEAASIPAAIVTNDSERVAREQVANLGWQHYFVTVVGYDSGFGEKPEAGPVLAGLEAMGVPVSTSVLVGDSMHDLGAARAAGVTAVYVGEAPDLRRLADLAVTDLDELATAMGRRGESRQPGF